MEKNTPNLWNEVWKNKASKEEDDFILAREENCIRWKRIEEIVKKEFGSFRGLEVIEIGAGSGTNAALMGKRGANITVLDYSENAIKRARNFFNRHTLKASFIQQDALSLPQELYGKFDISMSFGLTEHFKGAERVQINKAHFDVLKKDGIAFISVPNKFNIPYRLYKKNAELTRLWRAGEEYPYSRKELCKICREIGIEEYSFFGDSIFTSLNFVNPLVIARKLLKLKESSNILKIKQEKGTFLDQYLSYALVLCGKKASLGPSGN